MSRYLLLLCENRDSELSEPPPAPFVEAIVETTREWVDTGVLRDTGALTPIDSGLRAGLDVSGVTTGPAQASAAVNAYAIVEVESRHEAEACALESLRLHKQLWPGWKGAFELREILE